MLLYKSDWGKARELFAAWWEGEVKQPLLQVVAPKGVPVPYDGWDFCRYPDRPELAVRKFEEWCNQMFSGASPTPISGSISVPASFRRSWAPNQCSRVKPCGSAISEARAP